MEQAPRISEAGEKIANYIESRRLHHPALLLLEMMRPFSGALSIFSEGFSPVISLCAGQKSSASIQEFLRDGENLSRLIERLERTADQKQVSDG